MPKSKPRKKKTSRRVLVLPDMEHAKRAVLNSLTAVSGQQTYDHAIREFGDWLGSASPVTSPTAAIAATVSTRVSTGVASEGTG